MFTMSNAAPYQSPTISKFGLADFYNLHKGKTCVIVGLGPNLKLTPPTLFNYPTFGVNTIYKQTEWDWKPTYYVGVDERLKLEDGAALAKVYSDVPKFIPTPDWDDLDGENFYRFQHRTGYNFFVGGHTPKDSTALTKDGITYRRIMEAVFQIAWHMGFETMLMIGVQHKPETRNQLFWGTDHGEPEKDFAWEEEGYKFFKDALPARILNISADTYVPENILPRDDYQKWIK